MDIFAAPTLAHYLVLGAILFAISMMLFAMANAGLPGTSGFVGEFLVILAAVKVNFWLGFAAAITLILGAAYTLWMYKRVIFGDVANDNVAKLTDIGSREFWLLGAVAAAVLLMGVWPKPFIDVMYFIVVDSGRSTVLGSEVREALRCIRCGACMRRITIGLALMKITRPRIAKRLR